MPATVHPTAVVGPNVRLADTASVGPYAVLDGYITLGEACVVRPHALLTGRVVAGANNDFGPGCVIGDRPQHAAYKGEDTGVTIGDGNTFREHVTVHRAMPGSRAFTAIGNRNLFMAGSHIGHDSTVGDDNVLANNALLAGHVTLSDRVFLSGNSAVHQYVRVGPLALISGMSGATQDVPPFWIVRDINVAAGVNVIGMKRAGYSGADIVAVRRAFKMIYLDKMTVTAAADRMEREEAESPAVQMIVEFIRGAKRGVPGPHQYRADDRLAA
jgi:UDP-N-acetylglucosamine acyltransferase